MDNETADTLRDVGRMLIAVNIMLVSWGIKMCLDRLDLIIDMIKKGSE